MMRSVRDASLALAIGVTGVTALIAQSSVVEVLVRHGVEIKRGDVAAAFDAHAAPAVPVTPGSFATPLAVLSSTTGLEQIAGAYAFGILAGRSGRAAAPQELNAAGQALIQMIHSESRQTRVAGARVAGRVFAVPFDQPGARSTAPSGMTDAIFTMFNYDDELDQLAAMDALGLMRDVSAVSSLSERYRYYRDARQRSLAGGALEALARIGHPSTADIVKQLAGDKWADGKDATALAVAFARERMLKDGSIAVIRQAVDDKSRRNQARGYLDELGAPVP